MKLIFTPIAQEHWEYWKKNDPNITKRIKKLKFPTQINR